MRKTYQLTLLIGFFVFLSLMKSEAAKLEFTGLRCKNLDERFLNVTKCSSESVGKGKAKEFSVRMQILLGPVTNGAMKLKLMKKSIGYTLFYKEQFFDICNYFARRSSYPLINFLFPFIGPYTNINHTCPYKGELIIEHLRVDLQRLPPIPLPNGDYAFFLTWIVSGVPRFNMNLYFAYNESK